MIDVRSHILAAGSVTMSSVSESEIYISVSKHGEGCWRVGPMITMISRSRFAYSCLHDPLGAPLGRPLPKDLLFPFRSELIADGWGFLIPDVLGLVAQG
jgi:hypothetical protein